MGQIIRLPLTAAEYPDTSAELDPAESVLLAAVRRWVADFRRHDDPLQHLCEEMGAAGVHDAAFSVDRLMAVFVRSARRPLAVRCPRCNDLSEDEKHLLDDARLVQAGDSKMAERALRVALLSGQGAEFALGPLQGLCELFAGARLFFRGQRQAVPRQEAEEPLLSSTMPDLIG